MLHFIYFFLTNISTKYFKHAAHSPFFSSKCRLFHNATFFWFLYYSHFTYRVCKNLNVKFRCQKVNYTPFSSYCHTLSHFRKHYLCPCYHPKFKFCKSVSDFKVIIFSVFLLIELFVYASLLKMYKDLFKFSEPWIKTRRYNRFFSAEWLFKQAHYKTNTARGT